MKKNIYTYIAAATLFLTSCTDLDQSSISTIDKEPLTRKISIRMNQTSRLP